MELKTLKFFLLVLSIMVVSCTEERTVKNISKLNIALTELEKKESLLNIDTSKLPEFSQSKEGDLDKFEVTDEKQNIWIVMYVSETNKVDISFLELNEKRRREKKP